MLDRNMMPGKGKKPGKGCRYTNIIVDSVNTEMAGPHNQHSNSTNCQ